MPPFHGEHLALLRALLLRPALSSLLGHRLSPLSLVGSAWALAGVGSAAALWHPGLRAGARASSG